MKTKLLKKLRKRAHKEIGMCAYFNSDNQLYYTVERRESMSCVAVAGDYGNAIKRLNAYRRLYILRWVKEMRNEKINKDIKKL